MGNAAALNWENPENNGQIFGTNDVVLNASESTASFVDFWIKDSADSNYTHLENVSVSNGYATYETISQGDGEYDIKINNSEGSSERTGVIFDMGNPNKPGSTSPTGTISNTAPTVEMSVSDDLSGVDYSFINVSDSAGDIDSTTDTSLELDGLADDEHTVDYTIVDNAGNERTGSWTFTVDTTYDGDTSPSLSWSSANMGDGVILMNEDVTVTVGYDDGSEEPDEVTCYDSGSRIDSDRSSYKDDDQYQFDCDFSTLSYAGEEVDLSIEACDEAGNCDEYDAGNFVFDAKPPEFVSEPSTVVGIFNDDFTVDFLALDDASGLDELEYFFEPDTNRGDGNSVDISDGTEDFTVDVSDIDPGQHSLYVRLKDSAGRWSSEKSLNFEYDPDADPEVSLEVPESLTVTAGETEDFDITVKNTGDLLVSGAEFSLEGEGVEGTETIGDLYPNEETELNFEVSPNGEHIGSHTITVSSENPSTSKGIDFRVKANEDQQNEIESDLSEYQSKLEELDSNVSNLKEKGVSEDLSGRLDSDFSSFKQEIEDAQSAINEGNYYQAQSILEDIDTSYDTASNTYSEVKQTYEENQKKKKMMLAVVGLFGIVALTGGFLWRSEEYDFNYERIIESDIDVVGLGGLDLEGLKSRISAVLESEEEAEEFEWQGFS